MKSENPASLFDAFAFQVAWCRVPAPFTARVLQRSQQWLQRTPAAQAAFCALDPDPLAAAVALRWAGALHHLALRGLSPWAELWPPAQAAASANDGELDAALDAAIEQAWAQQHASVTRALARPPQTNEVQRSAALLPGLLHIAAHTGLALRLLEIGASAGLNLWPDRHHYDFGAWRWGDPAAALALRCEWRGPLPPATLQHGRLPIEQRAACDENPIDLLQPGEKLRLQSFIWPEQSERLLRLRLAQDQTIAWMALQQLQVQAEPAADFVERELALPRPGVSTVLMHSVVWQYMHAEQQQRISAALQAAGARASAEAPLAWLRLEPATPEQPMQLRCRQWPGGEDRVLAHAHAHGAWLEWCA